MAENCVGEATCQVAVKPRLELFDKPIWWHHHGIKARVIETGLYLVIGSSAARIMLDAPCRSWDGEDDFVCPVEWKIKHCATTHAYGETRLSVPILRVAFGLSNEALFSDETSQWLLDQFGGTRASQGYFFNYHGRLANDETLPVVYLNIPCPGTGHDGDPNISILVTDEIKEAVAEYLARAG